MICYLIPLLALFSLRVAAQDDAWHFDTIGVLVNEDLDPIVTPNAFGPHMHKVLGGSKFGASYSYNTYSQAQCSTVAAQSDKSNYWMPGESTVYVQLESDLTIHPQLCFGMTSPTAYTYSSPPIPDFTTS